VRARIEAGNAQREKKIEQLQDFIRAVRRRYALLTGAIPQEGSGAAADGGTRQIQYSTARSSASMWATFRRHPVRNRKPREVVRWRKRQCRVFHDFIASVSRGEKIALIGRNGAGKIRF